MKKDIVLYGFLYWMNTVRTQVLTSTKASHSHVRVKVPGAASKGWGPGKDNTIYYYSRVLLFSRVHPGRTASWYLRPIPTYMQVVLCTYYIMKIQYELVVLEINSLDNMYMSHAKYARSAALLHAVHARLPPKVRTEQG